MFRLFVFLRLSVDAVYFKYIWTQQGARYLSRYSESLRAGRSGDRMPVSAILSPPVPTGPGAYPTSYKMGTGSFPGGKTAESWL
jgi:hypothetical protein